MKSAASSVVASIMASPAPVSLPGSIAFPRSRPFSGRTSAAGPSISKTSASGKSTAIPTGSRNRSSPRSRRTSSSNKSKRKACPPPSMKYLPANPQSKSTIDLGRRVSLPRQSLAKAGPLTALSREINPKSTAGYPAVGVQASACPPASHPKSTEHSDGGAIRFANAQFKSILSFSKSTVDLLSQPLIWVEKQSANAKFGSCPHAFSPVTMRQWKRTGQKPTDTGQKTNHTPLIQVVTSMMNCFNLFH